MLHKFRKIAILTLCLVLICGLGASVYAASPPYNNSGYMGNIAMTAHARIDRYSTLGKLEAKSSDGEYNMGTEATVWMTFRYLDNDLAQVSDDLGCINKGISISRLDLSEDEAFAMVEADYSFFARPSGSTGGYQYSRYASMSY